MMKAFECIFFSTFYLFRSFHYNKTHELCSIISCIVNNTIDYNFVDENFN